MSHFLHNFICSNGIRMHYVEQGEGPVVILLHGWPESWYSWRHQIVALSKAGYRVIAPDQRGYGDTDVPGEIESYNILNLVGDVVGLLNALGVKEAAIVGHDCGSMVAAAAALLRPDLFSRVCLMSIPYIPRSKVRPSARLGLFAHDKHFYQEYFQAQGLVEQELAENIRDNILGILYSGSGEARLHPVHRHSGYVTFEKGTRLTDNLTIPEKLPRWLVDADLKIFIEQFQCSGFWGGINWYRNMDRNWELTPFWEGAKITQPLLFIAGVLDDVLSMATEEYQMLEKAAPRLLTKRLINNAGHWIQQECPVEVNGLLIRFLECPT